MGTTASPITDPITEPTTTEVPTTTTEPKPTMTTTHSHTTITPTTAPPKPKHRSGFDPMSFVGGILLTAGLFAIVYASLKYYHTRMRNDAYTRIDSEEA